MTHRLATNCAKNYCNRTPIVKVIVENVVTCFFGTRCIFPKCVHGIASRRVEFDWEHDVVFVGCTGADRRTLGDERRAQ